MKSAIVVASDSTSNWKLETPSAERLRHFDLDGRFKIDDEAKMPLRKRP